MDGKDSILERRIMASQGKKSDSAVKKKPMSWDDLHTLATLSKLGSFARTATSLKLARGTVVRRIERLEKALGIEIVKEAMGAVHLTTEGQRVLATALQMQDLAAGIAAPVAQAAPGGVSGTVRLTAPEGIAAHLIVPQLAALHAQHPQLQFELATGFELLSISHKQADVAVRLAYPTDSKLIAIPVKPLSYSLYASSSCAERHGSADGLLAAPVLIAYDETGARFPESAYLAGRYPDLQPSLRSNSLFAQIQAVREGIGVALLPDYVSRHYPELIRVSESGLVHKEVFIVYHSKDRETEKVRAVVDWLKVHLA